MTSPSDHDANVGAEPLSAAEELRLPREWRFSQQGDEVELPADAMTLLDNLVAGMPQADGKDSSLSKSDLIEFATQTWRLERRVKGMDSEQNKREYKQFSDSVRRFLKFLQRFDVEYEDPIGQPFTTGWLEVEVVAWDEPGDEKSPVDGGPWVKQTIAPIIRQDGVTIKAGQVVCVDVPDR